MIAIIILPSCQKNIHEIKSEPQVAKASKSFKDFTQVNLVANNDEYGAAVVDPNLINGWGIAFSSGGTAWVSAADNGVSTVYNREGVIQGISPVKIPSPGATSGGAPSGQGVARWPAPTARRTRARPRCRRRSRGLWAAALRPRTGTAPRNRRRTPHPTR